MYPWEWGLNELEDMLKEAVDRVEQGGYVFDGCCWLYWQEHN